MKRHEKLFLVAFIFALGFDLGATVSLCQAGEKNESNPLAPFEKFIGGKWEMQGSVQVLEWGVGKLSVVAKSYFVVEGKEKLVSQGAWFWHPGRKEIVGYFTAIEMPFVMIEYATRFEGDKMINELTSYSADGAAQNFQEVWGLTSKNKYVWTLYSKTGDGLQKYMSGEFVRK